MAFLPNYDMPTALVLVSGSDIWLNTPQPPLEASGTSGMKAALSCRPVRQARACRIADVRRSRALARRHESRYAAEPYLIG
jgi:hypothetical protein